MKRKKKPQVEKNQCGVKRCRQWPILGYDINGNQHRVCNRCWERHCDEEDSFDLKKPGTFVPLQEDSA